MSQAPGLGFRVLGWGTLGPWFQDPWKKIWASGRNVSSPWHPPSASPCFPWCSVWGLFHFDFYLIYINFYCSTEMNLNNNVSFYLIQINFYSKTDINLNNTIQKMSIQWKRCPGTDRTGWGRWATGCGRAASSPRIHTYIHIYIYIYIYSYIHISIYLSWSIYRSIYLSIFLYKFIYIQKCTETDRMRTLSSARTRSSWMRSRRFIGTLISI